MHAVRRFSDHQGSKHIRGRIQGHQVARVTGRSPPSSVTSTSTKGFAVAADRPQGLRQEHHHSCSVARSRDGKACQSRYHMSCLDPSLDYSSPGICFCTSCTKKRFQFGLHSIVDGIESVWDVKEAEGSI